MRECGDCTLCCTLLGIHQLDKKPFQDCFHCNVGKSCKIYKQRPNECKDFNCLWLEGRLPSELKPSECHVVMSDVQTSLKKQGYELDRRVASVYVDPSFPNAHKEGVVKDFLNTCLANGVELIVNQKGKNMLYKWGKIDE